MSDHHEHDDHHTHDHHHDHDDPFHARPDEPLNLEELDPASRSLAEAMQLSFKALKFLMVVLVIYFFFSGAFEIREGHVGVRMHLGAMSHDEVYEPGIHLAWPEPIDRVIRVSTAPRRMTVDRAFWFEYQPGQQPNAYDQIQPQRSLAPDEHGSLVTGDKNIVHARFNATYQVRPADAVLFVTNVSAATDVRQQREAAERLVRNAVERAVVHTVAQMSAEDFVRSGPNTDRLRFLAQQELDELETGLVVDRVELLHGTPPLAVREAFELVSRAESQRAQAIDNARRDANRTLNEVAGTVHEELLEAIEAYEVAQVEGDSQAMAEADSRVSQLLNQATGETSRLLQDAHTRRRELVSRVRADANLFQQMLPRYEANPNIVVQRLWQEVRRDILAGEVETFYSPSEDSKEWDLQVNRDPRVQRERERERLRQDVEQIRERGR